MDSKLQRSGVKILGDGGYQHGNVMAPKDFVGKERKDQNFLRGVIEIFFGVLGAYGAATKRFRGSPSEQSMCLGIIYELAARLIHKHPIRPHLLHLQSSLPNTCGPIATAAESQAFDHYLQKQ
jgi:hypothetical protein